MSAGTFQATRYHDICCGHRVVGHEGKCRHLHGHNYRIHFTVEAVVLDGIGRVVDFSVIKNLGIWLEENWDHKFLLWDLDKVREKIHTTVAEHGIILVPFNPTAENIARHLVEFIGPLVLPKGVQLVKVVVEETRKCSASYEVSR